MLSGAFAGKRSSRVTRKPLEKACRPLIESLEKRVLLAFGDLDSTFGTGGRVTTDFSSRQDSATAIVIDNDGNIYVAGYNEDSGAIDKSDFAIAKYNSSGVLVAGFDGDGRVTTNFNGGTDVAYAMALQADGKLIVVGSASALGDETSTDFAIARYNTNGSLDATFGTDGRVTTNFDVTDVATGVMIVGDKIVVVGSTTSGGADIPQLAMARYNANGTLDATFGTGGLVSSEALPVATGVALASDGNYLVAGSTSVFHVTKITTAGALDTTFGGGDGIVTTDIGAFSDTANAITVQNDGKIVVVGETSVNGLLDTALAVVRYNTNGTLDTTFSGDGIATLNSSAGIEQGLAVAVRGSDNAIIVAGFTQQSGSGNFLMTRFKANGAIDSTIQTDFAGSGDNALAVAIQADGKIVAAGRATGATVDFGLARYTAHKQDDIGVRFIGNGNFFGLDSNGTRGFNPGDQIFQFGFAGNPILVGDWMGTGTQSVGTYIDGVFYLDSNGVPGYQGGSDISFAFGLPGDTPIVGDWNGDGITDVGVHRGKTFFLDSDGTRGWNAGSDVFFDFGVVGATPLVGDWDGDGRDDVGMHTGKTFALDSNGTFGYQPGSDNVFEFGLLGATPLVGDWDGDGRSDIGFQSGKLIGLDSNGAFGYQSGQDAVFEFGLVGAKIIVGDWDGDGRSDIGMHIGKLFGLDTNGTFGYQGGSDQVFEFGLDPEDAFAGFF